MNTIRWVTRLTLQCVALDHPTSIRTVLLRYYVLASVCKPQRCCCKYCHRKDTVGDVKLYTVILSCYVRGCATWWVSPEHNPPVGCAPLGTTHNRGSTNMASRRLNLFVTVMSASCRQTRPVSGTHLGLPTKSANEVRPSPPSLLTSRIRLLVLAFPRTGMPVSRTLYLQSAGVASAQAWYPKITHVRKSRVYGNQPFCCHTPSPRSPTNENHATPRC